LENFEKSWRNSNRKRSGCVDCQQVKSVFLHTKATHFETMMTTVEEINSDKTKVADEFFCSVLLDCFSDELDEQTDS